MSDLSIPISRRQYDFIGAMIAERDALNFRIEIACNTIMASLENEPATAQLVGVVAVDGCYALKLAVPDDVKKEEAS